MVHERDRTIIYLTANELIALLLKPLASVFAVDMQNRTVSSYLLQPPGVADATGKATNSRFDGTNHWAVGYQDKGGDSPYRAFRANLAGDVVDLGTLGGPDSYSFATDVSLDGSVVVGSSWLGVGDSFNEHAFRWTVTDGMVDLGTPSGPDGFSRAFGVSGDGSVVVGEWSDRPFGRTHAFRWTADGGFQDLAPGAYTSTAYAVTADGSVVVGQTSPGNNTSSVFRWTEADGLQDLGTLPGYANATPTGISDDGQVIIGIALPRPGRYDDPDGTYFSTDCRAFIWTAANGMQDLTQVFANAGVDMTGITLVAATGISPDSQYVCGAAYTTENVYPNDPTSPFIAQLPP